MGKVSYYWWSEEDDDAPFDIWEIAEEAEKLTRGRGVRPGREAVLGPLAFDGDTLIGCGHYEVRNDEEESVFNLAAVAVDSRYEGKGIGTKLIEMMLQEASAMEIYRVTAWAINNRSFRILADRFGMDVDEEFPEGGGLLSGNSPQRVAERNLFVPFDSTIAAIMRGEPCWLTEEPTEPIVEPIVERNSPLLRLRNYLSMSDEEKREDIARIAAYNLDTLTSFLEERGVEDTDLSVDDLDPEVYAEYLASIDVDDIAEELMQHSPADAPTWAYMSLIRFLKNEWLVHLTRDADAIVARGFQGIDDISRLGLTTHLGKNDYSRGIEGYAFAYQADDVANDGFMGHSEAVIFQADALLVDHHGDDEYQAIFWSTTARNPVAVHKYRGDAHDYEWYVGPEDHPYYGGTLEQVAMWISQHYGQYRRKLGEQWTPAVRGASGTVYTGRWHPEAWEKMSDAEGDVKFKDGFVDDAGEFFDRAEVQAATGVNAETIRMRIAGLVPQIHVTDHKGTIDFPGEDGEERAERFMYSDAVLDLTMGGEISTDGPGDPNATDNGSFSMDPDANVVHFAVPDGLFKQMTIAARRCGGVVSVEEPVARESAASPDAFAAMLG